MRSLPRLLLGASAVILAVGGYLHATAFERALSAVTASNLTSFYAQSFKALWLIDSASLLTLAIIFGLCAARPSTVSRAVIVLLACIPGVTAFFQYFFIGTFLPAHMLLFAAVAAFVGGLGAGKSTTAPGQS
jgi:hypothetical protein